MDGSFNEGRTKLACMLADAERDGRGLTHQVFESLVRTVWEVNQKGQDAETFKTVLHENFSSLGGLDFSVKTSRFFSGAINVTGQFCCAGATVSHPYISGDAILKTKKAVPSDRLFSLTQSNQFFLNSPYTRRAKKIL